MLLNHQSIEEKYLLLIYIYNYELINTIWISFSLKIEIVGDYCKLIIIFFKYFLKIKINSLKNLN